MGWRQNAELIGWNLFLGMAAVLAGVAVMWIAGLVGLGVLEAAVPGGIQGIGWYPFVRSLVFFLIGSSPPSVLLAGYCAALIAHRSHVGHALAAGMIQLLLLLLLAVSVVLADPPLWVVVWYLPTLLLVIPAALFGGRLGRRRKEKRAAASPQGSSPA